MTKLLFLAEAPFEAARRGVCGYHGHSFRLRVRAPQGANVPDADGLERHARAVAGPLDYALLDEHVPSAEDPDLLTHLLAQLQERGVEPARLALRSAPDRGAGWSTSQVRPWCWRSFRFEAAHQLPRVPAGHPCGRMHGHGYEVVLESDDADAETLGRIWQPVGRELHRSCLNDFLDNPTSELIAAWLWERLAAHVSLRRIHVHETEHSGCTFDGARHTIWKAQRFEAATRVAGVEDSRGQLHGHSYRLRVHVSAPLDQVLGWTLDYGDVKQAFGPLREVLDHQRLDQLAFLGGGDLASVARWLLHASREQLPLIERIDVREHPGAGVTVQVSP